MIYWSVIFFWCVLLYCRVGFFFFLIKKGNFIVGKVSIREGKVGFFFFRLRYWYNRCWILDWSVGFIEEIMEKWFCFLYRLFFRKYEGMKRELLEKGRIYEIFLAIVVLVVEDGVEDVCFFLFRFGGCGF